MLPKSEYGLFIGCHGNCDVAALFISRTFAETTCADTPCRGSSGSIVSDYGLDEREIGVQSLAEAKGFSLAPVSRPALGHTQPPIQWVPGVLSTGLKRGRGLMLTTHLI
jgi:hypothetical protein